MEIVYINLYNLLKHLILSHSWQPVYYLSNQFHTILISFGRAASSRIHKLSDSSASVLVYNEWNREIAPGKRQPQAEIIKLPLEQSPRHLRRRTSTVPVLNVRMQKHQC